MERARPTQSRKLSKGTIVVALIVVLLMAYVAIYFANLNEGFIVYLDDPMDLWTQDGIVVPKYVKFQQASEIVFWPLFQIHCRIDPNRFEFNTVDAKTWPTFRNKWWRD